MMSERFRRMPPTPARAIAFFDGQNLYRCVKEAFGYTYPNYDPPKLAHDICATKGWTLTQTRFYTGYPSKVDNPFWHAFWVNKTSALSSRRDAFVYKRLLASRETELEMDDGTKRLFRYNVEKGIDVRLSIDIITLGRKDAYDVALVFSQDQDLSEVAQEIRAIADEKNRWIHIASAYPENTDRRYQRGINKTDWIQFDRAFYDRCIDTTDYRPPRV